MLLGHQAPLSAQKDQLSVGDSRLGHAGAELFVCVGLK